eukprot:9789802-Heterocapsa_arctica.AAC.1
MDGKRPSEWAADLSRKMEQDKGADMDIDKTNLKGGRTGTFSGQVDARAYPVGSVTKDWFVGQMVANTYAISGEANTWRQ